MNAILLFLPQVLIKVPSRKGLQTNIYFFFLCFSGLFVLFQLLFLLHIIDLYFIILFYYILEELIITRIRTTVKTWDYEY